MSDHQDEPEQLQLQHHQLAQAPRQFPVCLLAHDLEGSRNVGALFRIADSLGVEMLYLSGTSTTPPNRKLRKASRRTEKWVPHQYHEDPLEIIARLKDEGCLIVGLEITSHSLDIRDFTSDQLWQQHRKICLLPGTENQGLSDELLAQCDLTVHLPMFGRNSSMNVATACALALFEILKPLMPRR